MPSQSRLPHFRLRKRVGENSIDFRGNLEEAKPSGQWGCGHVKNNMEGATSTDIERCSSNRETSCLTVMKFPESVDIMAHFSPASVVSLSQKANSSGLRLSLAAALVLLGLYLYLVPNQITVSCHSSH